MFSQQSTLFPSEMFNCLLFGSSLRKHVIFSHKCIISHTDFGIILARTLRHKTTDIFTVHFLQALVLFLEFRTARVVLSLMARLPRFHVRTGRLYDHLRIYQMQQCSSKPSSAIRVGSRFLKQRTG